MPVTEVDSSLLARSGFLADLSPPDLRELAAHLRRRRYPKGQILFAQGEPGVSLFVVESGLVNTVLAYTDGKEIVLNSYGPGDVFGELSLLDGEGRSADAVVESDSQLLVLGRDEFVRFLEERPRIAISLLAIVTRKVRRLTRQVYDIAFLDVPARLAQTLLELSATRGKPANCGAARSFRATQTELASLIGATRESVNKWLGYFEDRGLVRRTRGQVTVLRPDILAQRAV
jgi:CRP/FNR family cyclic AMP-dependent transcriptional regulator